MGRKIAMGTEFSELQFSFLIIRKSHPILPVRCAHFALQDFSHGSLSTPSADLP